MMGKTNKARDMGYRLHTDAIEELVTVNEQNTPQYSREELEKYTAKKKRMPFPVQVFLIKAWFYGAVCFFVFWGLGLYVGSQLDLCVIAAMIMGMVVDLLVRPFLRFIAKRNRESGRHMMVVRTGVAGMMLNLLYAFVLMFLIVTVYAAVNAALSALSPGEGSALFLGVGPIGFALIAAGLDTLLISLRALLRNMIANAKR